MKKKEIILQAAREAFPNTLPILAGFLFLGATYGVYMRASGFSFIYPMVMSTVIFAGSMEFVTVNLLLGAFQPLQAFMVTLLVNARHLFYGLSMLEKYRGVGKKKWYMVFALCDETFSINCAVQVPKGVDQGWFMFFVSLFDQLYWIAGATLGGIFGGMIPLNLQGIDFAMTAMFAVIFTEHWLSTKNRVPAVCGLLVSAISLLLFGSSQFMIPAMIGILLLLCGFQQQIEKEEKA